MEEETLEAVSFLEEWLRREDETRAHATTDEERDIGRHALRDVDDTQMADAPGPSGIARKTTYSPTYDEPPIKAIRLVPYSDSEDDRDAHKKTIGTDDDPTQLVDYSDTEEKGGAIALYDMNKLIGRHIFGRRLLRQYNGTTATDEVHEVRFVNDLWDGRRLADLYDELGQMWKDLLQQLADEGTRDTDLVRIHIGHRALDRGDIKVSLRPLKQMTPDAIGSRIEEVLQSHQDVPFDKTFSVTVGVIHLPRGAGHTKVTSLHGPDNSVHRKLSMVQIINDDNLCLAQALVVCSLFVCWSLTSLCHSNGHIETMPAREMNPFTALTRIRSQFLRTQ